MNPITEGNYRFLKENAESFDKDFSKILDNFVIFSSYMANSKQFLIKIEPVENYALKEKHSTFVPDGKLKRQKAARLVLSINYYDRETNFFKKQATAEISFNRETKILNINYIQGVKGVNVNKHFREDLISTIISCTHKQVKDIYFPEIFNIKKLPHLEKGLRYIQDRFFDKDGKLIRTKPIVTCALQNSKCLDFLDFPYISTKQIATKTRVKQRRILPK